MTFQKIFIYSIFVITLFFSILFCCSKENNNTASNNEGGTTEPVINLTKSIPAQGNCWISNDITLNWSMITDDGISNWSNSGAEVHCYFKVKNPGELHLGVKAKVSEGVSSLRFTIDGVSKTVDIADSYYSTKKIGIFQLNKSGYVDLKIEAISATSTDFGSISEILIGGPAAEGNVYYVKDDFYWGRRGPSVHFSYTVPGNQIKWYYNEVTIPEEQDVIGSYYMANGFGQGYFGIQVNSETERRVLFSVWSPYSTDNPDEIPEEDRIQLLKKGDDVVTGEFGNEGSGGQSFLRHMWKTGVTYKFLLKGEPSDNNSTDFTAYFFDPEEGNWRLIASFRRPKTNVYLTSFYSFLENFNPDYGQFSRYGYFGNQWAVDKDGNWMELTSAKFTADATARKEARMDYAGGSENGLFYLKNCGFFDETTTLDTTFTREPTGNQPIIDFESLP